MRLESLLFETKALNFVEVVGRLWGRNAVGGYPQQGPLAPIVRAKERERRLSYKHLDLFLQWNERNRHRVAHITKEAHLDELLRHWVGLVSFFPLRLPFAGIKFRVRASSSGGAVHPIQRYEQKRATKTNDADTHKAGEEPTSLFVALCGLGFVDVTALHFEAAGGLRWRRRRRRSRIRRGGW